MADARAQRSTAAAAGRAWGPSWAQPLARLALALLLPLTSGTAQSAIADESAAEMAAGHSNPLRVAVREVPPFAWKDPAGSWQGMSVDVWEEVAERLDLNFEWRELTLAETWPALEAGTVDVAISAVSVTEAREVRFDFSHPYHVSGLAPAYRAAAGGAWLNTLKSFLSPAFLSAVGSLALVLLIAGALIWIFERKANAEQFGGGNAVRGLGNGFWWSAVTMTTVGYGDKAPKTLAGRIVGLIWMFASLIIIASFTASIAASLTANRLGEDQLRNTPISQLLVGVVEGTAAETYAAREGARLRLGENLDAALEMLVAQQVDTVVHDAPLLKYATRNRFQSVVVDDRILVRDDYAFAYANGSALREPVNRVLLELLKEPVWEEIRRFHLGALPQ